MKNTENIKSILSEKIEKLKSMTSKINSTNIKESFKSNYKKYKTQIISGTVATMASCLFLTGFALLDEVAPDSNLTAYYSAKSYTVMMNGTSVGTVRDKDTIDSVIARIENEFGSKYRNATTAQATFSVSNIDIVESVANDSQLISEEDLYEMLKSSVEIKSLAYGISIDGNHIGYLSTKEEAENLISEVKNHFIKDYDSEDIIEAKLNENIVVAEATVAIDEVDTKENLFDYIITGTDQKMAYTVQNGDTYWDIASAHDMSIEELFQANPQASSSHLMPGDELSLVVPKPYVSINVTRKIVVEEKIPYESETQSVSYMYTDQKKVKKAGVYGINEVEYVITELNGVETKREEVSKKKISDPETEIILVGTQTPPPKVGSGIFINPLPAATISSRYGYRSGGFHYGMDMAKAMGSSIKAADGGTVTYSGWYGSYGYLVEIDHGGGWTTRYAHCSKINVSNGEKVYQGQIIANVGSTGYSTGPHLHFEVRHYGSTVNPASYIGAAYK